VRAAAGLLALAAVASAARATDAPSRPLRIVSLAPSVTETLFALGAGAEVAGVSTYCDYPPPALKLPRVGTFLTPNLEAIVALRPTLVIGLGLSSDVREIHAVESMGCPVMMAHDDSLAEIEDSIAQIGERIGRGAEARALLGQIRAQVAAVREHVASEPPVRILMLVGHQPMVAVGRGTYLDDLLRLAGADNIADSASGEQWPRLSLEYIIAMRPDVILDGQMGDEAAAPQFWDKFTTIPAVRNHRVYGYPQDPILHPGPRVGNTLEMLAAMIHSRAFAKSAEAAR
jgi:cobalamin transport system substrate-binding protein